METGRMQTPLRRARYLGSARGGTSHFWRQRLTAIANVPLVIGFIMIMITLVGRPHDQVAATLASPLVAVVLLLMIGSITVHMRLGMQTFIEDYIHGDGARVAALIANTFFVVVIAALCSFAILKLALGG